MLLPRWDDIELALGLSVTISQLNALSAGVARKVLVVEHGEKIVLGLTRLLNIFYVIITRRIE